jgi:putative transposase
MRPVKEHEKPRRLKDFSYRGYYRYFITIRSQSFKHHFVNDEVVAKIVEILKGTAEQEGFLVWANRFMPDHMHLLVEGKHGNADMRRLVVSFKQKSGYWFKKTYGMRLWAPNYYEHVLRNEQATMTVARYIIQNPVRKGIVSDCRSYPYSGSFELEDICSL